MMKRDMIGRTAGVVLFTAFLVFHLLYLEKGWNGFNLAARVNSLLITVTILLFLSAYFLRTAPVSYSMGFTEPIYPLFCASLPLVIYHNVEILKHISPANNFYSIIHSLVGLYDHEFLRWDLVSMTLVITGNVITLIGIIYLKRSFSIMIEARNPVFTGIYRHVRHPLYLGEIIATTGVLIFRFSNINLFLTILFIATQVVRSRFEENKLSSVFPSYMEYKQKTGAFFPRL